MPVKCYLQVTAGVEPGIGIAEYTKRWEWSPKEIDGHRIVMTADELIQFHELSDDAHDYAKQIQNPDLATWVTTEWVWISLPE